MEQEDIENDELVANDNSLHRSTIQSTEPGGNIIWTFVSSVFRFTKLSLANKDQVKDKTPTHRRNKDANGSMTSVNRCSKFPGKIQLFNFIASILSTPHSHQN